MMPVDPHPTRVVSGRRVLIAAHQLGVRPLPAWALEDQHGSLLTRWHLTEAERAAILDGDDLWILISTHGQPIQPIAVGTKASDVVVGWPE